MALAFLYPMVSWVFYFLVPVVPAVYLIARWRAYREQEADDPQLGLKVLLYYFRTLGYHIVLAAEFCLIFGLLNEDQRWEFLRLAAAFAVGGGLIYGFHVWFLAHRSNTAGFPRVARMFLAFNLLICGLVGTGALLAGLIGILQKTPAWEVVEAAGALFVVYGSAWFAQTSMFVRRSTGAETRPS